MSGTLTEQQIIEFDTSNQPYTEYKLVKPSKNCNAVMVTNIGTTVCFVNDFPLNPGVPTVRNGESFLFGGNRGEIFTGRIEIKFTGNTGLAMVTQKFYKNLQ